MNPWAIAILVIIGVLIIYLILLFITFLIFFGRTKGTPVENNKLLGDNLGDNFSNLKKEREKAFVKTKKYEDIYIKSDDNLKLHAYLFENKLSDTVIIFIHGYKSQATFEGTVGLMLYRERATLLLVDQRACGKSEGKYITFGAKEKYDILLWINFINERYYGKKTIYIHGASMGAATTLMVSSLTNLPANVKGFIADSPYTSAAEVGLHTLKVMTGVNFRLSLRFIDMYCRLFAGFSLYKTNTLNEIKNNTKIPIFIIHGKADNFVPFEMGEKNYAEIIAPKRFIGVDGANHCQAYFLYPEKSKEVLTEFIWGK